MNSGDQALPGGYVVKTGSLNPYGLGKSPQQQTILPGETIKSGMVNYFDKSSFVRDKKLQSPRYKIETGQYVIIQFTRNDTSKIKLENVNTREEEIEKSESYMNQLVSDVFSDISAEEWDEVPSDLSDNFEEYI